MRHSLALSLAGLAALTAFVLSGSALARGFAHPPEPKVAALRALADHYRSLTWTYQRAAHDRRTPTSFSYRQSGSRTYLSWTIEVWTRRAHRAQLRALAGIRRRVGVDLPRVAPIRATLWRRLSSERRLALRLERIYPGHASRSLASARVGDPDDVLRAWQSREARDTLLVSAHAHAVLPQALVQAFSCIHSYEGAWTSNTGNGYYGGLQMDGSFERRYAPDFVHRWGTADNWPAWAQLETAVRAYRAGRGFWPWPSTARLCGLI